MVQHCNQKSPVRNEHVAAYDAGNFDEIPESILPLVRERIEARDALQKQVKGMASGKAVAKDKPIDLFEEKN